MSKKDVSIAIKKLANVDDIKIHICKVNSISGSTCDCTPINGNAPLKKVRLNSDINSDLGLVVTPTKDSVVIVCEINKTDSFVSVYSEIESISVKIGSSTLFIKDGEVTINGGDNEGLVKVKELTERLNKVETSINDLKNIFLSWIVTPQDGGAALKLALASWYGLQLELTQQSQIENTKVTH